MKSRVSGPVFVIQPRRSSPQVTCWKTQLLGFAARVTFWLRGFFFCTGLFSLSFAQNDTLSRIQISEVVYALSEEIEARYVDAVTGKRMAESLRRRLEQKAYDTFSEPEQLAQTLQKELHQIHEDFHLRVYTGFGNLDRYAEGSDDLLFFRRDRLDNFGLRECRIIEGNIGYIRLDEFTEWLDARRAIRGAMDMVSFSDGLILDLRENTGGAPETMQWLLSYFFPAKSKIPLTSLYFRETDKVEKVSVAKKVKGERYLDRPVAVLAGPTTASAAEGFAFDLQRLNRATIIGEKTRGGAQPARTYPLPHGFRVLLPIGKAVSPDGRENWEGTGIHPDIQVREEAAYSKALAWVIDSLAHQNADPALANWYDQLRYRYEVLEHQYTVPADSLAKLEGDFQGRKLSLVNGVLFYENYTNNKTGASRLLALPEGGFTFDSESRDLRELTRVFPIWEEGILTGLRLVYPSGNERLLEKGP